MARSRNIKPGFFVNDRLVELPYEVRLLFIGLWTLCDREGRMDDRPKKIKLALFPGDDIDVDAALDRLAAGGDPFIFRYEVDGSSYLQVVNWHKHQRPHHQESASIIPEFVPTCEPTRTNVRSCPEPIRLIPDTLNLIPDTLTRASHGARKNGKPDAIDFETFWQAYPKRRGRKVGKAQAKTVWSMLDAGAKLESITAATNYATACDSEATLAKDAFRFLQGDYWKDWLEAPEQLSRVATAEDLARWNPIDGGLGS